MPAHETFTEKCGQSVKLVELTRRTVYLRAEYTIPAIGDEHRFVAARMRNGTDEEIHRTAAILAKLACDDAYERTGQAQGDIDAIMKKIGFSKPVRARW